MDPNEALVALRDCAQDIENGTDEYTFAETAQTMAEKFEALDDWLSRGGFPPSDWVRLSAIEKENE